MPRTAAVILAAIVVACGTSPTPGPDVAATVQWDSAAANEARAVVEKGATAFGQMDLEGLKATLAEDGYTTSYDLDLENKPVRLATRADAVKYAEDTFAAVTNMNATIKVEVNSADCRATSLLAYCAMEHTFTATTSDGKSMSEPYRATIVLAKGADGWKWTHFHSSRASAGQP